METVIQYAVRVIGVAVVFYVGLKLAGLAKTVVTKALVRAKIDETLARFGGVTARWTILVLVAIACLGAFGINVTAFAAILAAAGFAIGLAFQGSLANVAAGVALLVFRPFKIGDLVKVAGHVGIIHEIGLFTTTIDTLDNRRVIIPNGSIFGSTIENIGHNEKRRVDIDVGCDYGTSIADCRTVLEQAAASVEGSIDEPQVIVLALGGSSVDWQVRVWCNTEDYWTVWERTIEAVKSHLDAANINIPYPQMDVHVDK